MVEVILSAAMICFGGECHPVLSGRATPMGTFTVEHRATRQRGYGGDVLVFRDDGRGWYAIHRTWPGRERMYGDGPDRRRSVSLGCINVQPEVYDRLVRYIQSVPQLIVKEGP